MKRSLILAIAIALIPPIACASSSQEKRAFTLEDFYRLKSVGGLRLSPDGKTVAYALTETDLPRAKKQTHLWLVNADGSRARQLTYGEKSERSPVFAPDGRWLAFVSDRDGSDNLYVMSLSGGEARRLTNLSTGVSDPVWSPDGRAIAFASSVYPECGGDDACNKKIAERWKSGPLKAHLADELLYRHWKGWRDGKRSHVLLAEASSGTVRDLTPGDFDAPTFHLGGSAGFDFSPDGRELVFVSNHDPDQANSTNADLWLVPVDSSGPARSITGANRAFDGSPRYSPDGRSIAYRRQAQPGYESDLFQLAVYDRRAGTTKVVSGAFDDRVASFQWAPDSRSLYFTAPARGASPIFRVTLGGKVSPVLRDRSIGDFELAKDGRTVVYAAGSVGAPPEVYSAALRAGSSAVSRQLTHLNDEIVRQADVRPAEEMWVDGALGAKIQVFIVKPHDFDPRKKYPLILNVHGGPQSQWSDAFRGDWQIYPGAGYVVAFANPHGSTGRGQAFSAQISGDFAGAVFEDLMKVTDALERLPYVDKDRMGAMGWSYGGYMMDWFEGHTDRFRALASMMGIYDLRSFWGSTEELWWPEWDLRGTPWTSADFEKFSPSNSVRNFKTPALVISGERDYRIPYTQSLQFFTALRRMGVPARLIIFPDAGHWPEWYEMVLYHTAHLEWFHKYLGGGDAPWPTAQFLRNAVFDAKTGERIPATTTAGR